jgi:cyclophilin family peptidyl-prolyl cis-trans isomerase
MLDDDGARYLDNQYTVFGRVIEDVDVVDKIAALETMVVGNSSDNRQLVNPEEARITSVKMQER